MATDDMEDVDVATKAPESDAREQSTPSNAQSSEKPTMGEHCVSDRPTPPGAEPKGEITTLANIETYVSKPQFYPSQPAKLLLLLSPGTGIHSTNNQLQADAWAEAGYVVIMPDQFGGDAVPKLDTSGHAAPASQPTAASTSASADGSASATQPTSSTPADGTSTTAEPTVPPPLGAQEQGATESTVSSWVDKIKQTVLDTAKSFRIDMWLARHTPATVLPRLVKVLEASKEMYADAVAYGGGVQGVGYCFGGRYVLLLAGELGDDVIAGERDVGSASASAPGGVANTGASGAAGEEGGAGKAKDGSEPGMAHKGPWLKATVLAHGTGIGREDFAGLKEGAKLGIVAVAEDPLFTDEVRKHGVKAASEKGVKVEEKVWPGVPHGFAVVGEYADQNIVDAQREAHDFMLKFLQDA